jgi:hypothetical protein
MYGISDVPISPTRQRGFACVPRWRVGLIGPSYFSYRPPLSPSPDLAAQVPLSRPGGVVTVPSAPGRERNRPGAV